MTEGQVSDQILTLPNILSMVRLLGVPLFLWAIVTQHDLIALLVLIGSGITDYLDGKIARAWDMVSRLGQLLDPIADRLYILATLFGLGWRDIIPWWLVAVILSRDIVLAAVMAALKRRGQVGLPVHFVGKAATFHLLFAFPTLLMAQFDLLRPLALPLGWAFTWWGVVLYWVAAVFYLMQARQVFAHGRAARA